MKKNKQGLGKMSYARRETIPRYFYIATDDILILRSGTTGDMTYASYTKIFEIEIKNNVAANSKLRFKWEMYTSGTGTTGKSRVYYNDVAVGTEKSQTSAGWTAESDDVSAEGLRCGDKLQLWGYRSAGAGNFRLKDFTICGQQFDWAVTI